MLDLLHKAEYHSTDVDGIRKVVYAQDVYVEGDHVLFIDENVDIGDSIKTVLTTSKTLFYRYTNTKDIQYFETLNEIENGAIVRIQDETLFITIRPSSNAQTLFFTSKCNHYCLMCSEPPQTANDDYLIEDNMKIIELLDKDIEVIGISGGEPTLLGDNFIKIVEKIRKELPETTIRVLTNGRAYTNEKFVKKLAAITGEYLVSEIPLYHAYYAKHDYIVQARNAFFETIEGFYNCAKYGLRTDVRIVISKQNYNDLDELIYFIYKNIPFVEHIALMGLEYIGFAVNNVKDIHISPLEYMEQLKEAIYLGRKYSLNVSIYNLPLCLVHEDVRRYAQRSISDWKNEFSDVCSECDVRDQCSGMFTSTQPYFTDLLKPIGLIFPDTIPSVKQNITLKDSSRVLVNFRG